MNLIDCRPQPELNRATHKGPFNSRAVDHPSWENTFLPGGGEMSSSPEIWTDTQFIGHLGELSIWWQSLNFILFVCLNYSSQLEPKLPPHLGLPGMQQSRQNCSWILQKSFKESSKLADIHTHTYVFCMLIYFLPWSL